MTGELIPADRNPFRVARIEALAWRAPGFDWEVFLARLDACGYRGAIVGPHGTGKTTLLLEAQARLAARGVTVHYVFLNEETRGKGRVVLEALREVAPETVLFLDGAEQLDPLTWQWLRWRAGKIRGLVITVHRPGRLSTLHTTERSEALLEELLAQLAGDDWARYRARAREHFVRCGGNVREVFFSLYDDCAAGRI